MERAMQIGISIVILMTVVFIYTSLNAENLKQTDHVLKDTTVKVIWREDVFDKELKEKVNVIKLNDNYFANITEPEKAVLGYLGSTIGNECYYEGEKSNVKCKILTALNLGAQCSEANKTFLKSWFKDDKEIADQIENCKPKAVSSVLEKTFDVVTISTNSSTIKVKIQGLNLDFKKENTYKWTEDLSFRVNEDKLSLIERKKQ